MRKKNNSHNDYPNLVIKNIEKAQPPQSQKRPSNRLFSGALTPASSSHPRVRRRALAYKCRMHRFRAAHTRARAKCIASHRRATFALPPPSPSDSPIAEQGRAAEGERESHTRARKNCTHASGGETASRQVGCTAHVYIYEHVCTYRYVYICAHGERERENRRPIADRSIRCACVKATNAEMRFFVEWNWGMNGGFFNG